jgi:hypothetical protein
MIIEGYVLYSYIDEDAAEEEMDFRFILLKYHDTNSRINLLSVDKDKSTYRDLLDGRKSERALLESHPFYRQLTPEQQARCAAGTQVFVRGLRRAAVNAGFNERKFNSLYGYFSGHSHTLPVSLFRVAEHKIDYFRPSEAQFGMAALAVTVALPCMLRASFRRIDREAGLHDSWSNHSELRAILHESSEGLFE